MRTLAITIQYDGTDFVGWQRQAHGASVQGLLEEALAKIEGRRVAVAGAGRTDAGVHALGQVASFSLGHPIARDALVRALNASLPAAIRVVAAREAAAAFHARFDARAKTYRYRILDAPVGSPFETRYAWHLVRPLDEAAMRAAAHAILGTHDFAAFRSAGSEVRSTVRTMFQADVARLPAGDLLAVRGAAAPPAGPLAVTIRGDGFLRHMVRALVGTLVEIGMGRRDPGAIAMLLGSGGRHAAGPTAPPQGLVLLAVDYGAGAVEAGVTV